MGGASEGPPALSWPELPELGTPFAVQEHGLESRVELSGPWSWFKQASMPKR